MISLFLQQIIRRDLKFRTLNHGNRETAKRTTVTEQRQEDDDKGKQRQENNGRRNADKENDGKRNADKENDGKRNADKENDGKRNADKENDGKRNADKENNGKKMLKLFSHYKEKGEQRIKFPLFSLNIFTLFNYFLL